MSRASNHTAVGIDGCRGGWIAAIQRPGGAIEWAFEARISKILSQLPENSTILVDMIIGLPDANNPTRECDHLARQLLSPYGSRVFPAPPREALHAKDYSEACALAREATGKAISKQCWYLFPKIRELDEINDPRIRESHPELVFARLNNHQTVTSSKKTESGQKERLELLDNQLPEMQEPCQHAFKRYQRKQVSKDDAIDALALCSAAIQPDKLKPLTDGAAAAIWY